MAGDAERLSSLVFNMANDAERSFLNGVHDGVLDIAHIYPALSL